MLGVGVRCWVSIHDAVDDIIAEGRRGEGGGTGGGGGGEKGGGALAVSADTGLSAVRCSTAASRGRPPGPRLQQRYRLSWISSE